MPLERWKATNVISKYEIFNLTGTVIKNFPTGVPQYPYTFIFKDEGLYNKVKALLQEESFVEQPQVSRHGERQWDWTSYMNLDLYYISVSSRVFNNTDFKGLILEELI